MNDIAPGASDTITTDAPNNAASQKAPPEQQASDLARELRGASETLLIPLACRARASREKLLPGFSDPKAEEICAQLDVDLKRYAADLQTVRGSVHRGAWFDSRALQFINDYPDGRILSLGSGLNTMFERVAAQAPSGGAWKWIDSDLAPVAELRARVFEDGERRTNIALDASAPNWTERVSLPGPEPLLVISEAVLIYLPVEQVTAAFREVAETGKRLTACRFVFDWCSPAFVKRSRRHPAMKRLKDESVVFQSSMRRASDVETYHPGWRITAESSAPMTRAGVGPAVFHALFRMATFGRRAYGLAEAVLRKP